MKQGGCVAGVRISLATEGRTMSFRGRVNGWPAATAIVQKSGDVIGSEAVSDAACSPVRVLWSQKEAYS